MNYMGNHPIFMEFQNSNILKMKKLFLTLLFLLPVLTSAHNIPRKQLIDIGWTFNDKEIVNLPHDWSAMLPIDHHAPAGNDGGYYPTGIGIYKKTLHLSDNYKGKKLWLYFEGVYQDSEVKVNGTVAGGHPYGYSSFWCDITDLVRTGNNEIVVKADNSRQKNCRWYSGSGIYRHVWLVTTAPVHVDRWGMAITTPDRYTVVVTTHVGRTPHMGELELGRMGRLRHRRGGLFTLPVCKAVPRRPPHR